jgi:hypothetical protein
MSNLKKIKLAKFLNGKALNEAIKKQTTRVKLRKFWRAPLTLRCAHSSLPVSGAREHNTPGLCPAFSREVGGTV